MVKNKKKEEEFKLPVWMDCTWRRIACEQDSCPICGKIKKNRAKHIAAGEDPDSMESALKDVAEDFKQTLEMIRKDAKRMGVDIDNFDEIEIEEPPKPEEFPLYLKVKSWRNDIYQLAGKADEDIESWPYLEAGEDLLWYANTIIAKTYRQLCNRWHLDNGDEYGEEDYHYTKRVLKECLQILKEALNKLVNSDSGQKNKFNLALIYLTSLEEKILKI